MILKSLVLSIPIAVLSFAPIAPKVEAKPTVSVFCFRPWLTSILTWGGDAVADPGKTGVLEVKLSKDGNKTDSATDAAAPYNIRRTRTGVTGGNKWVVTAKFTQKDGKTAEASCIVR